MSEIPPHETIAILDAISLFGAYIINVRRIEATCKKSQLSPRLYVQRNRSEVSIVADALEMCDTFHKSW